MSENDIIASAGDTNHSAEDDDMSLGVVFKGPEGIVLAADSRVTLTSQIPGQNLLLTSTYDNATKLLRVSTQPYVGVVTYGLGALGAAEPRTAHSFMSEFERELGPGPQMQVQEVSERLSAFFLKQWAASMPKDYKDAPMIFLVGGYDPGGAYGKVFEFNVPNDPVPIERNPGSFGIIWGGQREISDRVIQGFDQAVPGLAKEHLQLTDDQTSKLEEFLRSRVAIPIPYQFLPLQDCVNFCIFLIRTTIVLQTFMVGVRGVGGAIEVATITRTSAFTPIQQKTVVGEGSRITLTQTQA